MSSVPSSRHGLWPLLLLLGCSVVALAWATLSAHTGSTQGWMALLAAVEAAWMLSLGGLRAGPRRGALALIATLAVTVAASALLSAMLTGQLMALGLFDALLRLGPSLGLAYAQARTGLTDLVWLALALALAWRLGR